MFVNIHICITSRRNFAYCFVSVEQSLKRVLLIPVLIEGSYYLPIVKKKRILIFALMRILFQPSTCFPMTLAAPSLHHKRATPTSLSASYLKLRTYFDHDCSIIT